MSRAKRLSCQECLSFGRSCPTPDACREEQDAYRKRYPVSEPAVLSSYDFQYTDAATAASRLEHQFPHVTYHHPHDERIEALRCALINALNRIEELEKRVRLFDGLIP